MQPHRLAQIAAAFPTPRNSGIIETFSFYFPFPRSFSDVKPILLVIGRDLTMKTVSASSTVLPFFF